MLHAVEPARPVHTAADGPGPDRLVEDVQDHAFEVEDLEHRGPAERARVPRLTAGLRVEGRPVEDDGGPAVALLPLDDLGLELREIRVLEIETSRLLPWSFSRHP